MPENNSLPDIKNPVKFKKHEFPKTLFKEHLSAIEVHLMDAPTMESLLRYIPEWGTATWRDKPLQSMHSDERMQVVKDMFEGKILPSSLETINFVWLISNIDLIDVTHLLRHRQFSFSAVCTADRDMRHDDCLVKASILSSEFRNRFFALVNECKQLYAQMVDSDEISILDARTILPRALESHYFVHMNLRDIIPFLKQRLDRQIQPESDNIVAIKMWIELVKRYPMIKNLINVHEPDRWYITTAPTGRSSNIYMPEKRNDIFEWKKQWFLYKKTRDKMLGGHIFVELWDKLVRQLEAL